jgi:hypothetical protein
MSKRGRHRSADPELERSLRWLESLTIVKKVILGLTENSRHKFPPGFLKIQMPVAGGIKLKGFSGNGVVDLFVRVEPEHLGELTAVIELRYPR